MLIAFKHGANVKNIFAFHKKILEIFLSYLDFIPKFAPR